jgi:undecaprenyl-diphosphatase
MQEIFNVIILSLVQGIIEFLPISSSAHIQIISNLIGAKNEVSNIKFFLESATFFVVLIYFFSLIAGNLIGMFKLQKSSFYFFLKILLATLPFTFAFVFLHNKFQNLSLFLLLGSVLMLIAEKFKTEKVANIEDISLQQAFFIGCFQIFSIFSGFSRSGSTICGGLILGLNRSVAVRFSFLISLPLTFASLVYDFYKLKPEFSLIALFAFLFCFGVAIIVIKPMFKLLSNIRFYPFIIYRIILAFAIILVY